MYVRINVEAATQLGWSWGRWGAEEWLLRASRYAREESDTSGGSSLVSSHLRVLLVPLKEFPSPGSNLQRPLLPQLCCRRHDYSERLQKVEKHASLCQG